MKGTFFMIKEKLKEKIKPKKYFHFKFGSKRGSALLTQLRVGRSFLNSHSFVLGMEDLPYCDICYVEENTFYPAFSLKNRGMFDLKLSQSSFQIS